MSDPAAHRRRLARHHAKRIRQLHFAGMVFWVAMAPVTLATGLKSSVPYVALISVYALIVGHAAGWAGESAAVAAEDAADLAHRAEP